MPIVWRILYTLHKTNEKYGLTVGIPEIAQVYNLRTHGHSRFVLQLKSGRTHLVPRATQNDSNWKNKFFFVKRSSISGQNLAIHWVKKAFRFHELVPTRSDSDKRIEGLLEIHVEERSFHLDSVASEDTQHSKTNMSSDIPRSGSQFVLGDLDSILSGAAIVKQEDSKSSGVKPKIPNLRSKASGTKKRKSGEVADLEVFEDMDATKIAKKLRSLVSLGLEKLNASAETVEKELREKIDDLLKTADQRSKVMEEAQDDIRQLKQGYEELKISHQAELLQVVEEAKKSVALSVFQSRIKMAKEASTEDSDVKAWDLESWQKIMARLNGDKGGDQVEDERLVSQGDEGDNDQA